MTIKAVTERMHILILLSLVSSSLALLGIGRTQSVAVSGRLICNGRPAAGVKVKLYEKETKSEWNKDNLTIILPNQYQIHIMVLSTHSCSDSVVYSTCNDIL
ncbi:Transthyretin-like family protein [Necator americanus]|uniref:Transthyretin-like family protein n=1 Tax=Necator americanus TaxID=51031 RepID=W2TVG5_NECAM|nr:Transthyretin-like family protein [Necator americanus]ETN85047.1 Transthyretin-like family protein [Necator americanus]